MDIGHFYYNVINIYFIICTRIAGAGQAGRDRARKQETPREAGSRDDDDPSR